MELDLINLNIEEIYKKIKDIEIQGATNVAIATTTGLRNYLKNNPNLKGDLLLKEIEDKGHYLAEARENEPLAKNGIKYILAYLEKKPEVSYAIELCSNYLDLIAKSKKEIIEVSQKVFQDSTNGIFTHCHSSTAVSVIVNHHLHNPDMRAVCTETRPLFQGRITAKNLLKAGIDTTMVVDSAAESFILDRNTFTVDIIFIGADQITKEGAAINKIGSLGLALAAREDNDPIYVVTPSLKVDINSSISNLEIELRDAREVWKDAPEELNIVNPAFEVIPPHLITGFITECGILKPDELIEKIVEKYPWL